MEKIIQVKEGDLSIFIEEGILHEWFSCGYEICQGACCWQQHPTEKLSGGLVLPSEASAIMKAKSYRGIPISHCLEKHDGYFTTALDDNDRCVFCEEHGCGLKTASFRVKGDKFNLDIPVHCELYPLSYIHDSNMGIDVLRREHLFDFWCDKAKSRMNGVKKNITLIEFERRPLEKLFGEAMYHRLATMSRRAVTTREELIDIGG